MSLNDPPRSHPDSDSGAGAIPPGPGGAEFVPERDTVDVRALHAPILRELGEPRDGFEPVPIWLILLIIALALWGGWYLGAYSGGWKADVYNEKASAGGPVAEAKPNPLALGKRLYANCQTCHQANGQGVAGNYPPLDGSAFVNGPPELFARIVLNGLEGPLTVEGKTFNNVMPPWRATLKDDQIAAVMTYVRQAWGNKAPAVGAEVVAGARKETQERRKAWTAPELEAFKATLPAAPPTATGQAAVGAVAPAPGAKP